MQVFTDSCIAKDVHGEPRAFRRGQVVKIHAPHCPQVDGSEDVVDRCFYQDTSLDRAEHALAVLLKNRSWCYCSKLEIV
jgi:hypothetical protein